MVDFNNFWVIDKICQQNDPKIQHYLDYFFVDDSFYYWLDYSFDNLLDNLIYYLFDLFGGHEKTDCLNLRVSYLNLSFGDILCYLVYILMKLGDFEPISLFVIFQFDGFA
jgi:hypothetical protein